MKYFQHQCNMFETDSGAYIRGNYGLAGYALWCILLEVVGSQIDKRDRSQCYRIMPLKEWKRILGMNPKGLLSFLEDISRLKVFTNKHEELNLIQYEFVGENIENSLNILEKNKKNPKNLLKITIPILEDWCDNHTKNTSPKKKDLQATCKQELELNSELELELESKLKLENNTLVELKLNDVVNSKNNLELEQQIAKIYEFYKIVFTRPKYQLTEKRKQKIKNRLSEPVTGVIEWASSRYLELLCAMTELSLSNFHMGDNEQKKTYIEIEDHLFKSQEQVEKRLIQAVERENIEKVKRYLIKGGHVDG